MSSTPLQAPAEPSLSQTQGIFLVLMSAVVWSFGGTLARFLDIEDVWTVVFWRSLFAALFLLGFMLTRDGIAGTGRLFRGMGLPGIAVGACFATASVSFIIALGYTTVANIMLLQAGVPLIAALIGWIVYREGVAVSTWIAIGAVICGVLIMVSDSLTGAVSPIGDALALLIAFAFAFATVITRKYAHVRMTPAVLLGTIIAGTLAASQTTGFAVTLPQLGILIVFGAFNFGLGLALFVTGARFVPSALAALFGTAETVLAPLWVALIHGEIPSPNTIIGGSVVLLALLSYLTVELLRQQRLARRTA
ncbi:drug/metabolite transporter (DMT)-like permease [Pararhizobium capsulatum DSM 1112]|uniref:Drug/metabolite transporter (DMT)-like permease n=1 Tax=Pararhizobium capsulatum DSM 1112 TaxID=1121113 RepID=A0ABU0BL94_9HYPH|nr:DMT family transporter [Pararhizobium capsulatum]MDQ0318782.1 drug/metabolite transporter (DMT)-like permease [Pararhizobium capsulatum DSM 1112]